ncbi:hypothetical protein [Nonomuraea sp. NPDC048826]|uniref:hypothetical protein n=1 Tax=Nonomuraea sp. NPDC048826 TaxID=3364347 RepID=UPI00372339A3
MTSLLERLSQAEAAAAEKAAELREQLAVAEEELRRLSITRETVLALSAQDDEPGRRPCRAIQRNWRTVMKGAFTSTSGLGCRGG